MLGVAPADAVAFEDSPMGVRAAVAAGLTAVGVPDRPGVDLGDRGCARAGPIPRGRGGRPGLTGQERPNCAGSSYRARRSPEGWPR